MTVRQVSISEFKAHCTEEIRAVEKGGVILQVTRHGKPVATIEPSHAPSSVPLATWLGSGRGNVTALNEASRAAPSHPSHEEVEDVWTPLTIEQHIARQRVRRVSRVEDLLGDGTEEEWQGFDEELQRWRQEQTIPSASDELP